MNEKSKQNFFVGNDAKWRDIYEENEKAEFYKESKTDFVVCNYTPEKSSAEECEFMLELAEKFKKFNLNYIINNEFANWSKSNITSDGHDWCNTEDGCHRLNLTPEFVKALSQNEHFWGIMYDEMEHIIINRNLSLTLERKARNLPAFPLCEKKDVRMQGELLRNQCAKFAEELTKNGSPRVIGEHVFPVLFHTFASSGITPNFKSQKESYTPVQYACAVGAAMQYNTELWNCVDLWFRNTNPGHSPKEMYYNLLFSYLAGTSKVYVEGASCFFTDGKINEYGQEYKRFCADPGIKHRDYDFKDYKPEIAIIRYDDSYWGQCDPFVWRKILFGNKKIKVTKQAREFTKAFNVVTHGESGKNGLSWDRFSPWSLRPHRSFCSMNGVAVFDDRVTKENLTSVKLCFLCGYYISDETIGDVIELVKENGLTVVTNKRFCPEYIKKQLNGNSGEISDGKGKWIVTDNISSLKTKKKVKNFLGNKNEMQFTYGDKTVKLKIAADGNSFEII